MPVSDVALFRQAALTGFPNPVCPFLTVWETPGDSPAGVPLHGACIRGHTLPCPCGHRAGLPLHPARPSEGGVSVVLGGLETGPEQCGCLNRSLQAGQGGGMGAQKAGSRVASMDPEERCWEAFSLEGV